MRVSTAFSALATVLLAASRAHADPPTTIDMQEHIFGASNTNAVAGHGGLTVGVSPDGDLTVLSWPGPSFADQLAYLSSNDLDVRSQPHLGALDGMGAYLGLLVTTPAGKQLVFFRDPSFTHVQRYTQLDAAVPETTFSNAALGLTVVLTDIVSPDVDVLTRRAVVTRAPGSPVSAAQLVAYENLSPTVSRVAMLPFADWIFDGRNDFVAVYDEAAKAVIHVHPADRSKILSLTDVGQKPEDVDYGPVDALMRKVPTPADVAGLVAGLDAAFPPAVAAIVTTEPPPEQFHVGSDATPICVQVGKIADNIEALSTAFPGFALPIDSGVADAVRCTDSLATVRAARKWTWAPGDALAGLMSGTLDGSRLAACQTNAALIAPLAFDGDVAEGSLIIALGGTVAAARTALAQAKGASAAARQAASEKAYHDVFASVALPDSSLGPRVHDVALRALVNVYVARDRKVGAIVASVSRQPPYYIDWPRDGSFFDQGLDVAGLGAWVTQRTEWYATIQRRVAAKRNALITPVSTVDPDTGAEEFPAFAWEMNYYADGTIGGNIRFEIDNTALHVWSVVAHAASLQGAERDAYVTAIWPTTRDALDLLKRWRDPATGLPWPANEDDHLEVTSTLHGATAVYAALIAGARLSIAAGDTAERDALLARATELEAAILTAYYDDKTGLFRDTPQMGTDYIPGTTGSGSTAWLAWPARLLDPSDERVERQLKADLETVMKDIRGESEGGAYVMKNVISAALLGKDGGSRTLARDAVTRLADIATSDTDHFGEVFVTTHGAGAPTFSARVAAPHVWEGMLFYLSAMALSAPSKFDPEIQVWPLPKPAGVGGASGSGGTGASATPAATTPEIVGGCGIAPGNGGLAGLAIAALFAGLARRRVRKSSSK